MNLLTKIFLITSFSYTNGYIKSFNNTIEYSLALKQNNMHILEDKLLDISNYKSPNYGKYMNKNDIIDIIKPNKTELEKVTNWLKKYNTTFYDYGDSLRCNTSIYNLEEMFNIKLNRIKASNMFIVSGNYNIPKSLSSIIEFVEGLSNKYYTRSKIFSKNYHADVDPGYAGREFLNKFYNITWNKIKSNTSSGAIEYQGNSGFDPDDLNLSQVQNDEKSVSVSNDHIIGTDSFPDVESQLDMQMLSQIADNTTLWFWDDNLWLYSFAVNFFNQENVPDVISMSWGWAERDQCSITQCDNETASQYINRVNNEYIKIGLRGITITVASGDAGAPGRTSEGCDPDNPINPVFPGSSPWVTSVGGTFIVNSDNNYNWKTPLCKQNSCLSGKQELNINFNYVGWTAGGGFSIYSSENRPKWQNTSVNNYLNSNISLPSQVNRNGRGYPDVSMVAHNCPVFSSGYVSSVDGTSCSSPLFAGVINLLNDYQLSNNKPKIGFANPILYQMAKDNHLIFNDYTIGNNSCTEDMCCPSKGNGSDYGYLASKGWDPVYGLGTPNVGNMILWLNQNIKIHQY